MMRIASRSIRRGLVVMGVLSLGVSACRQEKPDTAQQAAVPGTSQATDSSLTRAERIAGYADSVLELERVAAAWAFADPSGESEGAEEREHTTYRTSLVLAERAVELDSSNAYAWLVMGDALATRANRGFGSFDTLDLSRALAALQRASELSVKDARRVARIQELLRDTRSSLSVLRQR